MRRSILCRTSPLFSSSSATRTAKPDLEVANAFGGSSRDTSSLQLGRLKCTTAIVETLPELFALFRCHLFPALPHPLSPAPPRGRTASKAPKKNLAEDQDAQRLPVGDRPQPENSRHKPVPQAHDQEAEDDHKQRNKQHEFENSRNPMPSHCFIFCPLLTRHRWLGDAGANEAQRSVCAKEAYLR